MFVGVFSKHSACNVWNLLNVICFAGSNVLHCDNRKAGVKDGCIRSRVFSLLVTIGYYRRNAIF